VQIRRISSVEDLEELAPRWRALAPNPLVGPAWLISWWRAFGQAGRELAVAAVEDDEGAVVGIAPWFVERDWRTGRTLRFLGSGAVCTDYLSVISAAGWGARVAEALAEWLTAATGWDTLALEGMMADDALGGMLVGELERRGAAASARPAFQTWRIELPASWETFLSSLSKANRKQVRWLERTYFQSGRVQVYRVRTTDELEQGFELLVRQHTELWNSRGEGGVFADPATLAFHRQATRRLLADGQLRLGWLELDGVPAASCYSLEGAGVVYSYQSGMNTRLLEHSPGALATLAMVQGSIQEGQQAVDYLRGDEDYKSRWRALPHPARDVRVFAGHGSGRGHRALWQVADGAKRYLRAARDRARALRETALRLPPPVPREPAAQGELEVAEAR
jgi:CelD/BcsL family acetyltransferase involved in cellulose biosynthesis